MLARIDHLLKPKSLVQSDSEDEGQLKLSESLSNVNLRQRPSGILRKHVPLLHEMDKKYKGAVASRKDFEQEEDELDDSEEDGDSDEDDLDLDSASDDDPEDEEDIDLGINDFISQFKSKVQDDIGDKSEDEYDEDSSAAEGEHESDEEEESASGEDDSQDEDGDVMEDEDDETDAVDEDEAEAPIKILQPTLENPVQKGQAVRNQLGLWERILETRIKIQPVLNKANAFPPADVFLGLHEDASNGFKELAKETQQNVAHLLDNLIELQNTLMAQFSETRTILRSGLYKRKFLDNCDKKVPEKRLCLELQSGTEEAFKSYSHSVIQKWSDRTKVTNARSSKELLSNHSVLNQIEGVLLNKPDLIRNSQTVKGTYELFGQKGSAEQDEEEAEEEVDRKWSAEVYDDTDFYHQMLRELIEYKSNSTTDATEAARTYSELQKLKGKIKKQVDQKASKGRKIRYVVHKKLVSFMAPYSDSNWTEEAVQELFTSLFGNYNKAGETSNEADEEKATGTEMKVM